jgi:hypothetical protein
MPCLMEESSLLMTEVESSLPVTLKGVWCDVALSNEFTRIRLGASDHSHGRFCRLAVDVIGWVMEAGGWRLSQSRSCRGPGYVQKHEGLSETAKSQSL